MSGGLSTQNSGDIQTCYRWISHEQTDSPFDNRGIGSGGMQGIKGIALVFPEGCPGSA